VTSDGFHSYTYDAEGNVLQVDGGSTAQYVYDALNRRVRVQTANSTYEYLFDYAGRRISSWLEPNNFGNEGRIYWGNQQIAYRAWDSTTFFDYQDWQGTERMRTDYTGAIVSTYGSLPSGDGYTPNENDPIGNAQDNLHFAMLDHDSESGTEHAQFRQYSSTQGRWMSPDPYDGSYHFGNPQSFNRYTYVKNNPLGRVDPLGLLEVCDNPNSNGSCDDGQDPTGGSGPGSGDTITIGTVLQSVDVTTTSYDPIDLSGVGNWMTSGISLNLSNSAGGGTNAPNNGRNCSPGSASAGQYVAASAQVAAMTAQFFSGAGSGNQTFGPNTSTSAVMGQSAGVQDVLNSYYMTGETSGLYSFGAVGAAAAGGNPVAQFVGSFRWGISGGVLSLTNTTSFRSLTYDAGPQWQRSSFAPMGNTHQTYQIGVTCH
jgi:RHS repeat-associated protein